MKFADIEEALQFVSSGYLGENTALVCRSTGEIYWQTEDREIDDIPEEAYESDDWFEVPTFRDIGCGTNLVSDFAGQYLPDDFDDVQRMFRRAGAYGRFKALLERRGLLEEWYQFESARQEHAIRQWCEDHGIELTG